MTVETQKVTDMYQARQDLATQQAPALIVDCNHLWNGLLQESWTFTNRLSAMNYTNQVAMLESWFMWKSFPFQPVYAVVDAPSSACLKMFSLIVLCRPCLWNIFHVFTARQAGN